MRDLVLKILGLLSPRERAQGVALLAAMALGSVLEMIGVGAIPAFVAIITDPEAVRANPVGARAIAALGVETPADLVIAGGTALLVLFVVKNLYLTGLAWAQARYAFGRQAALASRLFADYLYRPYTFHLQRNTADLLRNTNYDALSVIDAGLLPLMSLAMEVLTVAGILALLFVVEPLTSLAAFVAIGGTAGVFLRVVRSRSLAIGAEQRAARGDMIRSVQEGLGGIKVATVLGRRSQFAQALDHAIARYARAGRTGQVLSALPRLLLETVAVAGLLGGAALLVAQGREPSALVPTLALMAVAVVRMIPAFNKISATTNALRFGKAAVDGVYDDLVAAERTAAPDPEPVAFERSIAFDAVVYQYPGASAPSLDGVSIEVPRGTAVGLVGPTGSGKTTLVDVLLGLLPPTAGRVVVDGLDIRGREGAWQRHVGYIPQDVYLTDASVRQNVAFGVPEGEIDEAAVWRAVDAAQVREFVERLPEGLDTVVGERGTRLSGGQRQRIGIARALYSDPDVLVMDEATSALDHATEQVVMDAVDRLRGARTLIIIAHRLSTVASCDRIYVLEDGRVRREGTPAALGLAAAAPPLAAAPAPR